MHFKNRKTLFKIKNSSPLTPILEVAHLKPTPPTPDFWCGCMFFFKLKPVYIVNPCLLARVLIERR